MVFQKYTLFLKFAGKILYSFVDIFKSGINPQPEISNCTDISVCISKPFVCTLSVAGEMRILYKSERKGGFKTSSESLRRGAI